MSEPRSICLLRLSALGDVSHVLPLLHAWRTQQPADRLSWIIGSGESQLLAGLGGVELLPFRKKDGLAGMRALWQRCQGQSFDGLLLMQLALRANLLSLGVRAKRRVGYDRARSKEGHSCFVGERIAAHPRGHVLETLSRFGAPFGVHVDELQWDFAIPDAAHQQAREWLPGDQPLLGISACSSHPMRNWNAAGYAALAQHAHDRHGMGVVLLGGRSELERRTADAILRQIPRVACVDLVGKDTLKQLLAVLTRLTVLVTPDAGPSHLASALGTPVIALHAATDARRSGPYRSLQWSINHFDDAARQHLHREPEQLAWGRRIEFPGVMDRIQIDEVRERLDSLLASPADQRLAPARLRA